MGVDGGQNGLKPCPNMETTDVILMMMTSEYQILTFTSRQRHVYITAKSYKGNTVKMYGEIKANNGGMIRVH